MLFGQLLRIIIKLLNFSMPANDKSARVQAKIRSILSLRKKMTTINGQIHQPSLKGEQDAHRIQTLFCQRPASSRNSIQMWQSTLINTDSSSKLNEQQLESTILNQFQQNEQIKIYFKSKGLNAQQYRQRLLKNEVFVLSLIKKCLGLKPQNIVQMIGKQIILRVEKAEALSKNEKLCRDSENRIFQLIDRRLLQLQNY